ATCCRLVDEREVNDMRLIDDASPLQRTVTGHITERWTRFGSYPAARSRQNSLPSGSARMRQLAAGGRFAAMAEKAAIRGCLARGLGRQRLTFPFALRRAGGAVACRRGNRVWRGSGWGRRRFGSAT